MKISVPQFQLMKKAPNSAYGIIMPEFLFHSNKLEGSTFSEEELTRLVDEGVITGNHTVDDVLETKNSIDLFDFVIDTLGQPVEKDFLCEMDRILHAGTTVETEGFSGHYKIVPNRIRNSSVQVALPSEVESAILELEKSWNASDKDFGDIVGYHVRFEHIHPFQDGNGRIGRFLMLKQCIENKVDLIVVDEEFEQPYKAWLEIAQTKGDQRFLEDTLSQCQRRFTEKMVARGVDKMIPR